jgi:hypothetical protein
VFVTVNGRRRKITKREAVIHQLVNKSTSADLRATKMLMDMMKEAERNAGVAEPPTTPPQAPRPWPGEQAGDQELLVRSLRTSIEGVNKVVRTSRQMLTEIGREPTPEEVANKLSMPLEKVRKLLEVAGLPIRLEA